jgi:hypothetical protein
MNVIAIYNLAADAGRGYLISRPQEENRRLPDLEEAFWFCREGAHFWANAILRGKGQKRILSNHSNGQKWRQIRGMPEACVNVRIAIILAKGWSSVFRKPYSGTRNFWN